MSIKTEAVNAINQPELEANASSRHQTRAGKSWFWVYL